MNLFSKKKNRLSSASIGQITWRRFRKNKPAMLGFYFVAATALVAILGYALTNDKTPFANDQKPELHILAPGTSVNFLLVRKNEIVQEKSFLGRMLIGAQSPFQSIPFYALEFKGDKVFVEEYTGHQPNKGYISEYGLADVLYPLQNKKEVRYDSIRQRLRFMVLGSTELREESIISMRETVLKNHVQGKQFLLGTDLLGRDVLSRLIIGTRISLTVGLISVLISILIGITLGALAGYYRGLIDSCIMWLINVVWSIPTLLLVIAITLVLGKGVFQVFIAVGLTMWVEVARIVRGQILGIREKEFVEAGRALGFSDARIIFKHVLPNVMGPVIVIAAGNFASAILMEAGLSFLGIGAQPPVPSWGEMINAHRGYILMDKAYLAFIPGLAIMFLVLAFMLLGNGLRDALDTRAGEHSAIQ
ncbi:MAG: ABC transporter permease [Bacteroidia bacterium]|nr:ABC transporter permease [Bacteroidia bacterium]